MTKVSAAPVASLMKWEAQGSREAMEKLAADSTNLNATLRTTCVATMLDGGHALHALPQTAGAVANCRILPDMKPEEVLATLKKVIADDHVSVTPPRDIVPGPP